MANRLDILREIERHDPDGRFDREPTAADREQFMWWVIACYGTAVWKDYRVGGWEPREYV